MSKTGEETCLDREGILKALWEGVANGGAHSRNLLLAGPWGSGKTTLLLQLCEKLRRDGSDSHVLWFSPWDTVADGDARTAFLRLLRDELKLVASKCTGNDGRRAKKLLNMLEDLLSAKPVKIGLRMALGGVLGGNEAFILGSFVRLGRILMEEAGGDEKESDSGPIQKMRAEVKKHLAAIAKAHGKKRLILLVDDLDRARPEEAIAILDGLYHLLMPHHGDEDWPLTSIWAVNTAVLEEYLYQEYRNLPSFDPSAYLEKLFDRRISIPPLFHDARNLTTEADDVSEAFQLWRKSLEPWCLTFSRRGFQVNGLAHRLAEEVNYAILGNLRLHARVRQDCIHLWCETPLVESDDTSTRPVGTYVRDARLIVLVDAFSHFRERIVPYNGMWPDFINQLNARLKTPPAQRIANPLYRHVESPDLATLLSDLGVLHFDSGRMVYELDEEGRRRLQGELSRLWAHGI